MSKSVALLGFFLGMVLSVNGQISAPKIVLNHFLVIVDSTTYQEILASKILNSSFAFGHEKKLSGYSGIYIIGQANYIEIFHPKSIENQVHNPGESWICHTAMKVNHLENLHASTQNTFTYSSDDAFDELSLYFLDSSNLFTTREMNKGQYESWTKKTFHDSVTFLPIDYNSPAESDSSKNYVFTNVAGIRVSVNQVDSADLVDYLTLLGYAKMHTKENKFMFSNSVDFVEVDFHQEKEMSRVTAIYMKLNSRVKSERIQLGNSELRIKGDQAIWELEK